MMAAANSMGLASFFHHMRRHGFTSHLELVSPGVV